MGSPPVKTSTLSPGCHVLYFRTKQNLGDKFLFYRIFYDYHAYDARQAFADFREMRQ